MAAQQGGEAAAGGAAPPQPRSGAILLANVTRRFGQTQILSDSISTARHQDACALSGAAVMLDALHAPAALPASAPAA